MNFYVPPHMEQNYDDFLKTNVCYDLELCHDYYVDEPKWEPFRAEVTLIKYKAKQYGSDNSVKIRFSKSTDLRKGDYVKFRDGIYLSTWKEHNVLPDSKTTIIEQCNVMATIYRMEPENLNPSTGVVEELDPETGLIINKEPGLTSDTVGAEKKITLIEKIPALYVVSGNYEVRLKNSQPGLQNETRTKLVMQHNKKLLKINNGDYYKRLSSVHRIHSIDFTEVGFDDTGLLTINMGTASNYGVITDG